jgi:uncharacterized protein with HEPN domain
LAVAAAARPDVPWSLSARFRDLAVHRYGDLDLDILWRSLEHDLPQLGAALDRER